MGSDINGGGYYLIVQVHGDSSGDGGCPMVEVTMTMSSTYVVEDGDR